MNIHFKYHLQDKMHKNSGYIIYHKSNLLFLFLTLVKGLFKGAPLSSITPSSETPILPETFNSSKQLQH